MSHHPYVADTADYRPDRFYRYAELTAILNAWAAAHPGLATLASIGQSHEGRELWAMTLTQAATGAPETKPAYFIDANIHAGEITGSAVCLYTIHHVLTQYGVDAQVTRLLDDFTLYIVPRVSPDGAEAYMTQAEGVRSSVRPYPDGPDPEGLRPQDLDGDGFIAMMRLPDPAGPWKASTRDPRLMVPRAPDEAGGTYFWLLPEGLLTDEAAAGLLGEIKLAPKRRGLDLNRNFPIAWEPEGQQAGAGPYPLSEPETRALADFILAHPNIAGSQHYHTFSGVILRPSSRRADVDLPAADLRRYQAIGQIGEAETGYKCISIYENFTMDKRKPYPGMGLDWAYDHLGLVTFSTELWSLGLHVGCEVKDPLEFYFRRARTEDDDVAMLTFCDTELGGVGYQAWAPFEHPQLGRVEIGGWRYKLVIQNAPGPLLPEICRRNTAFTLRAALCSPRIRVREAVATDLGGGLYRVEAVAENDGYLPTSVTDKATTLKTVQPDRLTLSGDFTAVEGLATRDLGWIPGREEQDEPARIFGGYGLPTRRKAAWVVRAVPGSTLTVTASSQRAGTHVATLQL